MSAIDTARAALEGARERLSIRVAVNDGRGVTGRDLASLEAVTRSLAALIAEHERLTIAPTEDERDALALALLRTSDTARRWDDYGDHVKAYWLAYADTVIADGWRPIHTDGSL